MLGCRGAAAQEMEAPKVTDFWRLLKFGWHLSIGHALFILYAIVGFRCVPRYYNRSVGHALFSSELYLTRSNVSFVAGKCP